VAIEFDGLPPVRGGSSRGTGGFDHLLSRHLDRFGILADLVRHPASPTRIEGRQRLPRRRVDPRPTLAHAFGSSAGGVGAKRTPCRRTASRPGAALKREDRHAGIVWPCVPPGGGVGGRRHLRVGVLGQVARFVADWRRKEYGGSGRGTSGLGRRRGGGTPPARATTQIIGFPAPGCDRRGGTS
jgi:hypothetical protein